MDRRLGERDGERRSWDWDLNPRCIVRLYIRVLSARTARPAVRVKWYLCKSVSPSVCSTATLLRWERLLLTLLHVNCCENIGPWLEWMELSPLWLWCIMLQACGFWSQAWPSTVDANFYSLMIDAQTHSEPLKWIMNTGRGVGSLQSCSDIPKIDLGHCRTCLYYFLLGPISML